MKKGWQTQSLGDVLEIRNGRNQREVESVAGKFPIYGSAGNVMGMATDYICEAGTTIIGRKGNINSPVYAETRFWNVDTAFGLTAKAGLDSRFLYFFCLSYDFSSHNRGTTIPSLVKSELLEIEMPVPSLAEQQRIVCILDEAFEVLGTAKANADKNLKNARALFESHHNSIFSIRREGWAEKPLGEVCDYVNGKAHEQCIDDGGRFIVINSKFISTEGEVFKRSNDALLMLQPGEIAMVLSDVPNGKALAKCFLVEEAYTYTLNQRICLVRSTKFHTKFLFYQLNRNRHFLSFDNGGNQTNLRLNQVLSCPLFLPPVAEQEIIADTLHAMSEETKRLAAIYQQKLAALEALRKSLLHQAFSGEL